MVGAAKASSYILLGFDLSQVDLIVAEGVAQTVLVTIGLWVAGLQLVHTAIIVNFVVDADPAIEGPSRIEDHQILNATFDDTLQDPPIILVVRDSDFQRVIWIVRLQQNGRKKLRRCQFIEFVKFVHLENVLVLDFCTVSALRVQRCRVPYLSIQEHIEFLVLLLREYLALLT